MHGNIPPPPQAVLNFITHRDIFTDFLMLFCTCLRLTSFNYAFFNRILYVVLKMRITLNDKLINMWKEVSVAYFKALFLHLPGEPKKTTISFSKDSQPSKQESNPSSSECEMGH